MNIKKSDVTNGMHVILNNDEEYVVIDKIIASEQLECGNTSEVVLAQINGDGWMNFDNYDEDFREKDYDDENEYDIKEIYSPLFYMSVLKPIKNRKEHFVKVWERPKRMTKEEIEAELGYEIEIVD